MCQVIRDYMVVKVKGTTLSSKGLDGSQGKRDNSVK